MIWQKKNVHFLPFGVNRIWIIFVYLSHWHSNSINMTTGWYVIKKLLWFYFSVITLKSNFSYRIFTRWLARRECNTRVVPVEFQHNICRQIENSIKPRYLLTQGVFYISPLLLYSIHVGYTVPAASIISSFCCLRFSSKLFC